MYRYLDTKISTILEIKIYIFTNVRLGIDVISDGRCGRSRGEYISPDY